LWIFPRERGLEPGYDQKKLDFIENEVVKVVSGNKTDGLLYINQDAAVYKGSLKSGEEFNFRFDKKGFGAYLFVLEGSVILDDETLNKRDAAGISDSDNFLILSEKDSKFIIIEIPMN
jgi:redox-sensitive bicupin YhaK (pirin superfamily)